MTLRVLRAISPQSFITLIVIVLAVASAAFFLKTADVGIVPASFAEQQEEEAGSVQEHAQPAEETSKATDAVRELVEEQPVTREVRMAIQAREAEVESREKEIARREAALRNLQQEVQRQLAELESKRQELAGLTQAVDQQRQDELGAAVGIFKTMDSEESAKLFNQMDLDLVVAVLKQMSPAEAGEILMQMRKEVASVDLEGADPRAQAEAEAKLERLKVIGETLVDPMRAQM